MGDRKPVVVMVRAMAARMDDDEEAAAAVAEVESRRGKVLNESCWRRRRGSEHMLVYVESLCVKVSGMVCGGCGVCARAMEEFRRPPQPGTTVTHDDVAVAILLLPASTAALLLFKHFGRTRTRKKALATTRYLYMRW